MRRSAYRIQQTAPLVLLLLICSTMVSAAVDGDWNLIFLTEAGDRPISVTLKSDGENVSGMVMNQEMKGTFRDGKLSMKLPEFYSDDAGFKADFSFEGLVDGNTITGTWHFAEYTGAMKGSLAVSKAAGGAVSGAWKFVLFTEAGDKPVQVNVVADGESVSGKTGEQAWVGTFKDGVLNIKAKDFYSPAAGFSADLTLTGKVNGKDLTGSWEFGEYSGSMKGTRIE